MSNLIKFVNPAVNIPFSYPANEVESGEVNVLLLNKCINDLKMVKEQSLKKSILFKLLNGSQLNSNKLREITEANSLLLGFGSISEYQKKFGDLEFELLNELKIHKEKELAKSMAKRDIEQDNELNADWGMDEDLDLDLNIQSQKITREKYSKCETSIVETDNNDNNSNNNELYILKKRLFNKSGTQEFDNSLSSDVENELEEKTHEEMIEELAKLTKALKNNTIEFNKQIETADKDIISKTETNLLSSGDKLQVLGSKLGKFSRSKLGVFFYLTTICAMMLGLFVTYFVIKIFPEM
ncbi:hypothetical protein QEN19_000440 [Hanseniaspora menglaensis]